MRRTFVYVTILILISQLSIVGVEAYSGSQIDIPLLSKPVTIDGKWTSVDEWSDAVVVMLVDSAGSKPTTGAYLYAKHDQSTFYFLIDFISATTLGTKTDDIAVFFDPMHNRGTVPQLDDRIFVTYSGGGYLAVGTNGNWSWHNPLPQGAVVNFSTALVSSSNRVQPHEIAELQVPFSIFQELQDTIGFAAEAARSSPDKPTILARWPANRERDNPSTWGELSISQTWNVLSDDSRDVENGENGEIVGDLGQTCVDISQLAYGFANESLNFRFALRGKIPNETPTGVGSIWYQVLLDSDPNKGLTWGQPHPYFTPEYMVQLLVEFPESAGPSQAPSVSSSVLRYSGTGSDWKWIKIDGTERLGGSATAAGGVGQDYFVVTCKYQTISSEKGVTFRFLARSGILYDGKVYNDYLPNKGTVSIVFNPVPEFPNTWLVVGVTLLVSLVLVRRPRQATPQGIRRRVSSADFLITQISRQSQKGTSSNLPTDRP